MRGAAMALLSALFALPASAVTITETTTVDDATSGNCSLREAVQAAQTNLAVDAPRRFGFPAEHLPGFDRFLDGFAGWMVNRASPDDEAPREQLNTL